MNCIYCPYCGCKNLSTNKFCIQCGNKLPQVSLKQKEETNPVKAATKTLNGWTGEDRSVDLNLSHFFNQVFKRHTKNQAELIFIAGTKYTTPTLAEVSERPVQPWLYTRVFIFMLITVCLLGSLSLLFQNNLMIAFMVFLCFTVPISLTVFFFEINVFKNISFYTTIEITLIGGLLSIVITMCLYTLIGNPRFTLLGALTIGVIEETGKVLIGAYFINKMKLNHVFNGMLIGGAIGAGFAAFENIQYATTNTSAVIIPIIRSFSSLGSHSLWCAITVSALALAKGNSRLSWDSIKSPRFFNFFFLAVIFHGLWDWDTPFEDVKIILLIIAGWLTLFVLVNAGLREVKQLKNDLLM